jgi:hypothetical protein
MVYSYNLYKEDKMPEVILPNDLFARLKALSSPLVPTLPGVIAALLEHFEKTASKSSSEASDEGELEVSRTTPPLRDHSLSSRAPRERGTNIEISSGTIKTKGHLIRAVTVPDLYEQWLRFVVDEGLSKSLKELLPFRTGSRRYLIAERPIHPKENPFFIRVSHRGFFMEAHKSYATAVKDLKRLTEKLGLTLKYLG